MSHHSPTPPVPLAFEVSLTHLLPRPLELERALDSYLVVYAFNQANTAAFP